MSNDPTDHTAETPQQPRDAGDADSSEQAKHPGWVKSGVATDVWISLKPYPDSKCKQKRLCLRVDEEWRHLDDFDEFIWQSVQSVFCNCTNTLEVVVWYRHQDIVGLVVRSKYSLAECD